MTTIWQLNPNVDDTVDVYIDSTGVRKTATAMRSSAVIVGILGIPGQWQCEYLLGWDAYKGYIPLGLTTLSVLMLNTMPKQYNIVSKKLSRYTDVMHVSHDYEVYIPNTASPIADTVPSMVAAVVVPTMTEKPCRNKTCGKMNDLNIGKCWNCETLNPSPG